MKGEKPLRNLLSGKTQRERPTRPATAASAAKSSAGVRLPPPTLAPPPKVLTAEEEQQKVKKAAQVEKVGGFPSFPIIQMHEKRGSFCIFY